MIKEILLEEIFLEGAFEDAMENMKAINKMIDKAIKDKDQKTLDSLGKDLGKILKDIKK